MVNELSIITAYIINLIALGADLGFQQIKKAQSCFYQLTTKQSNYDQDFKLHLLKGNYKRCIKLIEKTDRTTIERNLTATTTMAIIETDEKKQQEALNCVQSMYDKIFDINNQNIQPTRGFNQSTQPTRGFKDLMELKRKTIANEKKAVADLIASRKKTLDLQDKFLKATKDNDDKLMSNLLSQGAKPDERSNGILPVEIAIGQGNKKALAFLYEVGVKPSSDHLERAKIYLELTHSNQTEPDMFVPQSTEGLNPIIKQCTDICEFIEQKIATNPKMKFPPSSKK